MILIKIFVLYVCIILMVFAAGCSTTVPVTVKLPPVPKELNMQCPPLKKIPDEAKLSDVSKTVAENYKQYKECSTNNSGLLEWYNKQKETFNGVK